jgi:hypothetical protein
VHALIGDVPVESNESARVGTVIAAAEAFDERP